MEDAERDRDVLKLELQDLKVKVEDLKKSNEMQNYIDYSIKTHTSALARLEGNTETAVAYHKACIEDLKSGRSDYDFTFESGRKYHKIIMDARGSRSVHAFIDKKTGEVYKSASWKAPAKGVRFNLCLIKDREWLFENADWAGSYLYAR